MVDIISHFAAIFKLGNKRVANPIIRSFIIFLWTESEIFLITLMKSFYLMIVFIIKFEAKIAHWFKP